MDRLKRLLEDIMTSREGCMGWSHVYCPQLNTERVKELYAYLKDHSKDVAALEKRCEVLTESNRTMADIVTALEKKLADAERRNRVLDTHGVIFEHGYKTGQVRQQALEDRADRAEEMARVFAERIVELEQEVLDRDHTEQSLAEWVDEALRQRDCLCDEIDALAAELAGL